MIRVSVCSLLLMSATASRSDEPSADDSAARRFGWRWPWLRRPSRPRRRAVARTRAARRPAKPCDCCRSGPPAYDRQYALAMASGQVLVGFFGCAGSCVDGALAGVRPGKNGGKACVLVGYPKDGTMFIAAELPAGASPERIRDAIRLARAKMAAPSPCPGGVCPTVRR